MNIAIVCYHNMGGSGIIAYELGAELARKGHKVHFLGLEPPFRMNGVQENVMFHSVEVKDYPVFTYPPYTLSLASRIFEVVAKYEIDVIHCHYAVPHAVAGILAKQMSNRPVKVITTLHGTDITLVGSHPSFYNITRWAIEQSDCVTAVSDFLIERTEDVFGIEKGKIQRVYNFVNEEFFNPDLDCPCLKKKCGIPVIIHASNLRAVKQPEHLIHIFNKVYKELDGKCALWILGEGPLKNNLEKLVLEYGLEDAVEFFGVTSNPGHFFACADICLMTSQEESFGLAALEAMACRTSVVAYSSGGIPEVVEEGVSGRLIEPDDIDAAAAACIELLRDPEMLKQMKERAYRCSAAKFSKQTIMEEYIALCEQ